MKKNIAYMAGAFIGSAMLTFGCSEDLPSYSELTVDSNELFIQADGENPFAEVNITSGNGNYKVEVTNEDVATATMNGDKVVFNGLKNGTTTATLTDWTHHSTVINIRVKEDFELKLDKEELILTLSEEPGVIVSGTVDIMSGNGGYVATSSNEAVAMAEIIAGNKVLVTAVAVGHCDVTVTDADGNETTLTVTVCKGLLEVEDIADRIWGIGETSTVQIVSGNGGYTVTSSNESIATATIEGDVISVTGKAAGEATLTVTDQMELITELVIKVKAVLSVDRSAIDFIQLGENATEETINLLGGSGDYEIVCSNDLTAELSADKTKLTIKGKDQSPAQNQTVTVTDKIIPHTVTITVGMVNYPFEEYGKGRYFINGILGVPAASEFKTQSGLECLYMGTKSLGRYKNGFVVKFEGDHEVGAKNNAKCFELDASGNEVNEIIITGLEIYKRASISGGDGQFWIRFHEQGKSEWSYIVTWT